MGLVERIKNLVRANLSELLDRAEDPEKVLDKLIADMEEDLADCKLEVAAASRDERRLHDQYLDTKLDAERMEQKAILALQQAQEDLAREALRRKKRAEILTESLQEQWNTQHQAVEALRVHLEGLDLKLQEARRKKDLVIARKRLALARKGLQETSAALSGRSGPGLAFSRLAERVQDLEAEADAAADVSVDFLESKFENLADEGRRAEEEIEAELERLRRRVASKPQGLASEAENKAEQG